MPGKPNDPWQVSRWPSVSHVIRCWVRTSPPSPLQYGHWVAYLNPIFGNYPQTRKRCHMDLWSARLVLTHHHRHRLHPSLLHQHLKFRVSDLSFFIHGAFSPVGCLLPFFCQAKSCFPALPFCKKVMRVALLFGPLALRLTASNTVSLEKCRTVPWPLVMRLLASTELQLY